MPRVFCCYVEDGIENTDMVDVRKCETCNRQDCTYRRAGRSHEIHDLKRRLCVAEHGSHDLPNWSEVRPYEDATGERVIGRACRRDCSYYEDDQ